MSRLSLFQKYFSFTDDGLRGIISTLVAFVSTGIFIRIYEIILVTNNFVLPDGTLYQYVLTLPSDLFLYSYWSVILFLVWILLFKIVPHFTIAFLNTLIVLFFVSYIGLIQYYGEVLVLLGVDFWAYNFGEITDTVNTSVSFGLIQIIPYILFPLLFLGMNRLFNRMKYSRKSIWIILSLTGLFGLVSLITHPESEDFEKEVFYSISVNKASYFYRNSATYFFSSAGSNTYRGQEYPLLRTSNTPDVLGRFFNKSENPPNFVFVIVESLGGTLMPPHASYGGFTPFMDSLAKKGLYWTHFLATSGRSFNAQPVMFGSLPYGRSGFMDLGAQMPEHHSLISILNNNGYQTNYFGGYNTNFDNLNQFLDRQRIDLVVNESRFPDSYEKMDMIEGNFTWGYADHDLYDFAFTFLDDFSNTKPRLDIFFTLNFHEPFIIPNAEAYNQKFNQILNTLELPQTKKDEYQNYKDLFSALLYTDDSIRGLINRYKNRADFERTIFIITGDHRMVPIPHRDRIARYYVPFMIYSPMLRESREIKGVSSHLDVTPSLLGYLAANYEDRISIPEYVHWMGDTLSTSKSFAANKEVPFMRTKNQIVDYLSGTHFLSDDRLYTLYEGMLVGEYENETIKQGLQEKLNAFKSMNTYVTENNKLLRLTEEQKTQYLQIKNDTKFLQREGLLNYSETKLFEIARDSAIQNNYEYAQIILRNLLRKVPDFHDARLLYGRTFAWNGNYTQALPVFEETLKRAPEYSDVYVALADLYYWQSMHLQSLKYINEGLERNPDFIPLIYRKARTHYLLKEHQNAREWTERGLQLDPDNVNLNELKLQLNSN
ncbi:MAG: sulfatase-like hydrolase/transferase [Gracilimonas sp.]